MLYGVIFMDMFFGILFILFMFIGVLFSVYAVLYNLLKPKGETGVIVYLFDENTPDIHKKLAFLDYQLILAGIGKAVLVDNGMNNIQRAFCEKFCSENGSAVLVYPEEITEVL